MVSVLQAEAHVAAAHRVASLVSSLVNAKALTAVPEHLRHEGESVQTSILVERSEDFLFAQHLYPVTSACVHVHRLVPLERLALEL